MGGASTIVSIFDTYYGATGEGGDTPTEIAVGQYGQGDFYRFEFFDESIIIMRPSKEFLQQGIAQFYEKDSEFFQIRIAAVTGETRFDEIEAEVRRICLNYGGGSVYSRLHLDSMKEIPHHYYAVGEGMLVAYLNLAHANDS